MVIRYISWASLVIWMAVIFNLSSQPAEQSNQLSTEITEVVVKTIEKVAPTEKLDIRSLNNIIRNNAHFFNFMVLGLLSLNAIRRSENSSGFKLSSQLKLSNRSKFRSITAAVLFCVLYAAADEIHQLFVPGRGAQMSDVMIDIGGAAIGILLYLLASRIFGIKYKLKLKEADK